MRKEEVDAAVVRAKFHGAHKVALDNLADLDHSQKVLQGKVDGEFFAVAESVLEVVAVVLESFRRDFVVDLLVLLALENELALAERQLQNLDFTLTFENSFHISEVFWVRVNQKLVFWEVVVFVTGNCFLDIKPHIRLNDAEVTCLNHF